MPCSQYASILHRGAQVAQLPNLCTCGLPALPTWTHMVPIYRASHASSLLLVSRQQGLEIFQVSVEESASFCQSASQHLWEE